MAKIIVSGATGLLGRALFARLNPEHQVIGLGFSRAQPPVIKADLFDKEAISALFAAHRPDFFIHSAAERNPDKFDNDPEHSIQFNCAVTEHIAKCCAQFNCTLIFISTDYVFDGRNPPYAEDAETSPLNLYGQSKARSEALLQTEYPHAAIIRIPVLYGEVSHLGESAVTVIAEQLKNGVTRFDDECQRFPTDTADIATALAGAIATLGTELEGIYHLSANERLTKLGMAKLMAPLLGLEPSILSAAAADTSASATRPLDCALKDTRLGKQGIEIKSDFATRIAEVLTPHLSQ
ncbi:SDR family oxidoreductase [Pseudoalteromonas sp. BDTF-M6]|uniref:dTDP-4-dehydrorhamnose reductase family protein n=1 Tax=Pseudoalteromonas sp. BDTF-M6 TaxID=2796132 RepID=UPI001BAFFC29|nr:SDR family oxidoreductase [Pseudoalteromonas sp. BDTF-M6]MBS3798153.1 SDR family oxidoreductase [Pseudoalteromonas sp. BDTF-M6]